MEQDGGGAGGGGRGGGEENKRQGQKCPRCESVNTKFCYYNNYSLSQPRYYCKGCKRYWTQGGTLRNIPVGGASRKPNKRPSNPPSPSSSKTFRSSQQPHQMVPNLMAPPPPPPPPTVVQSYDYGGDAYLSFNIQPPPSYGAGITADSVVGFGAAASSSSSFGSQSSRFYDQIGNLIAPSTARANSHGLHDPGTHRFANIGAGYDAASLWSTISTTSIISGGNSSHQTNTRGGSSSSSSLIPNSDYMPHLPGYAPPPPPPPQ